MQMAAEDIKPYDNEREKGAQVEQMFDSIAPAYDFMNTAMSFGLHRHWRNKALRAVASELNAQGNALNILDIACGTGDVAFELRRRYPDARIVGVDLSEGMLQEARKKLDRLPEEQREGISFEKGDSLALRFDNDSFDLVTVAYGVRNFEHLEQGLREMARVLRPGGMICVIELSEPTNRAALAMYKLYSGKIIPALGRMVSGDSRAYSYLPESIAAAPQRDRMTEIMQRAGFSHTRWKSLSFGAVTYYLGKVEF